MKERKKEPELAKDRNICMRPKRELKQELKQLHEDGTHGKEIMPKKYLQRYVTGIILKCTRLIEYTLYTVRNFDDT